MGDKRKIKMKLKLNLFIKSNGDVRMTKRDNGIYQDEIYLKLELNVPDALFKRPVINAAVDLSNSDVKQFVISPEIHTDIQGAIESIIGADVKLTVSNE